MPSKQVLPDKPKRVIAFVGFFKRYMNLSAVIVAALPIPITAFKLIPAYSAHTQLLSVITPLFCFLILGYVFYLRQPIGRALFIRGSYHSFLIPFYLIMGSFGSFVLYFVLLKESVSALIGTQYKNAVDVLQNADFSSIRSGEGLILTYILAFAFAEASFVLMALKEYLQDILNLSDIDVITRRQ